MHDYDPAWDYEMDDNHEELVQTYVGMKDRLMTELLPQLNTFDDFELAFVIFNDDGLLGVYCDGTQSSPVICLDMYNIRDGARKYGVRIADAVETTILHELGHAYQEWMGVPYDCEWAEDFTERYFNFYEVLKEG